MTYMSWRKDYETGVPQIDAEHRSLFNQVNAFHESYTRGDTRKEVSEILTRLVAYAEEHFQHEESLMRENAYPLLERHEALHAALVMTIFSINEGLSGDPAKAGMKTVQLIKGWLVDHILGADMDFAEFQRRKSGPADKPPQNHGTKDTAGGPAAQPAQDANPGKAA